MAADPARSYPSDMPVLALRDTLVLPLTVQPLAIDRPISLEAVNRALGGDRLLFLVLQANDKDDPEPGDLRTTGTIAAVRQMARVPAGGVHVIVEGLTRARSTITTRTGAAIRATVAPFPDGTERTLEDDAYVRRLRDLMERAMSVASGLSQELRSVVAGIDDPLRLAYLLTSLLDIKATDKQAILEQDSLTGKLKTVADALTREVSLLELKGRIESAAEKEMGTAQREYFLRQQLKAIQEELGEGGKPDLQDLRGRIAAAKLPEAVATVATREVERLERMTPASPEYQMIRTYIDWVLDVPWATVTEDRLDPRAARTVLDEDHYDLDKIKDRIVEYLAVQKLKSQSHAALGAAGAIPAAGTIKGPSCASWALRAWARPRWGNPSRGR
ncbi:MAG: LON peptidase substrate-binding domain-containing protein [Acidobacteriota bacterium]